VSRCTWPPRAATDCCSSISPTKPRVLQNRPSFLHWQALRRILMAPPSPFSKPLWRYQSCQCSATPTASQQQQQMATKAPSVFAETQLPLLPSSRANRRSTPSWPRPPSLCLSPPRRRPWPFNWQVRLLHRQKEIVSTRFRYRVLRRWLLKPPASAHDGRAAAPRRTLSTSGEQPRVTVCCAASVQSGWGQGGAMHMLCIIYVSDNCVSGAICS
jgi:hypothetical protein